MEPSSIRHLESEFRKKRTNIY